MEQRKYELAVVHDQGPPPTTATATCATALARMAAAVASKKLTATLLLVESCANSNTRTIYGVYRHHTGIRLPSHYDV